MYKSYFKSDLFNQLLSFIDINSQVHLPGAGIQSLVNVSLEGEDDHQ